MNVKAECSKGHHWNPVAQNILLRDTWCPRCEGLIITLEDVRKAAECRGGALISTEYQNAHEPLNWRCADGHVFEMVWNKVQQGRWCPVCSGYFGEEMCRYFFEHAFGEKFPKKHPQWLRPPQSLKTKERAWELDGYCEELRLAFEHHGDHKYRPGTIYARTQEEVDRLQQRMTEKRDICVKNNIRLIEIRQVGTVVSVYELRDVLIKKLEKAAVDVPPAAHRLNLITANAHGEGRSVLANLRLIAKKLGGELLSTVYVGSNSKLQWRCKYNHTWEALSGPIKRGTWCLDCGGRRRGTIEQMHDLAANRGFKCVSTIYVNTKTELSWECAKGHHSQKAYPHRGPNSWTSTRLWFPLRPEAQSTTPPSFANDFRDFDPEWARSGVQGFVVPHESHKERLVGGGVSPERVLTASPAIQASFTKTLDRSSF